MVTWEMCSILHYYVHAVADPGFPRGSPTPDFGLKAYYLRRFVKNCMEMKEIGLRGEAHVPGTLGSNDGMDLEQFWTLPDIPGN